MSAQRRFQARAAQELARKLDAATQRADAAERKLALAERECAQWRTAAVELQTRLDQSGPHDTMDENTTEEKP